MSAAPRKDHRLRQEEMRAKLQERLKNRGDQDVRAKLEERLKNRDQTRRLGQERKIEHIILNLKRIGVYDLLVEHIKKELEAPQ